MQEGGRKVMDLESRVRINQLNWVKKVIKALNSSYAEMIKHIGGGQSHSDRFQKPPANNYALIRVTLL